MLSSSGGGWMTVVRLGGLMMILELHREGVPISDIARRTGLDRKTVRKYIALLPRPQLPRPRRPQRPVPAVVGRCRQRPHPRDHTARRRRAFRRGAAEPQAIAGRAIPG